MNKIIFSIIASLLIYNCFSQTPPHSFSINGSQPGEKFGTSFSAKGDYNGDGYPDLIVGAPYYTGPEIDEGRILVYNGSAIGFLPTPSLIIEGNQASSYYGYSVACAGDVNNDGYSDAIVGAPNYDNGQTNEGRVFIYHGSSSGLNLVPSITLEVNQASCYFGYNVNSAFDVNDDGFDDIIIGAYKYDNGQTDEGRAYCYLGAVTGINPTPNAILESNQASSNFGWVTCGVGDVNNDGFYDVAIGSPFYDNPLVSEGRVYVFHGTATGLINIATSIMESNVSGANFGKIISTAGDLNNDGFDDMIVGADAYAGFESYEGAVYIFKGSVSGIDISPIKIIESNRSNARLGSGVSGGGDFNNDGFSDVALSSIDWTNDQVGEGRIMLFQGLALGISESVSFTFESDENNSEYGKTVELSSDINDDGYADLIVGTPDKDIVDTDEGALYIYYGSSCSPTTYFKDQDNDGFGSPGDSIVVCDPMAGFVLDINDCNDLDSLQNPNTIWLFDEDEDGYYSGSGLPLTTCEPLLPHYFINSFVDSGDCDDLTNVVFPTAIELLDGLDNDCNGLIDDSINYSIVLELEGIQTGALYGHNIVCAGDVNADGFDDALICAYKYDNGQIDEGVVYVHLGNPDGINVVPSVILESNQAYAYFGYSAAGAGDVNGDGFDDIIIGAHYYDGGQTNEGRVSVYYGNAAGISTTPSVTLERNIESSYFGKSLSSAGDVNDDGFDDIIIGYTNGVYLYKGSAAGIIAGTHISTNVIGAENFGASMCSAGDINGDGYDDVAIGAYTTTIDVSNEGAVYIYYGTADGINTTYATRLAGNAIFAWFGFSIAGRLNLNGDAYSDLVIGAYTYDDPMAEIGDQGRVCVFYGGPSGLASLPDLILEEFQANAIFGHRISNIGDIDGDGFDDIAASASSYDYGYDNVGRIQVFRGGIAGLSDEAYITVFGNQVDCQLGAISNLGDYNGDGRFDLIIGAPYQDEDIIDEGVVYLLYFTPECLEDTFYLDNDGDSFGNPLIFVLDCDMPYGHVENSSDCDDSNPSVNPISTEICNSVDDDCNGVIDDGITVSITIAAGGPTVVCQGTPVVLTATHTGATLQWKRNGTNIAGATSVSYSATTTGIYTCVSSNACATATSSSINVTVNKNPKASITAGGPTTFCVGGSVTLTELPSGGCTYQWYKGASAIAGATTTTYVATTPGNYKCRVTKTATGCFKTSNTIAVSVPCRDGEELENEIVVYPNPATTSITISTNNLATKTILISNAIGQIVYQGESDDNAISINIEHLASGMYFVKIEAENTYFTGDFVKQ